MAEVIIKGVKYNTDTGAVTGYDTSATDWSSEVVIESTIDGIAITSIGVAAFDECASLTSIIIPNGVISVSSRAFLDCSGLTSVTIPNSVTSIGNSAFCGCTNLTSVTIPDSATSIGESAFAYCSSLTSITIPNSITILAQGTFGFCSGLTSIVIPHSVTSIGNSVLLNCSSLTSVTIPDSVTSIGNGAFRGCGSLTSITIPDSVTSIGSWAFQYCSSLTSITIGESVKSIGSHVFYECSGLTSIIVDEKNKVYDSRDNCNAIIKTSTNTLIAGCKNTIIPSSTTSIGNYAFRSCNSLTSITIPSSILTIGNYAFLDCNSLEIIYDASNYITEDNYTSLGITDYLKVIHVSYMKTVKIPKLQNKYFTATITGTKILATAEKNSQLNDTTRNLSYQVIKKANILSGNKKCKITFRTDPGITSMSADYLEVPYGSTLSYEGDTFIATGPDNTRYTITANCIASYHVRSWGKIPAGELLSNLTLNVTSAQSMVQISVVPTYGTIDTPSLYTTEGSQYSISGNVLSITDIYGTTTNITFTPNTTDTYYTYGNSVWNGATTGTLLSNKTFYVATERTEKTYACTLSWGQNNPRLADGEYHGWDNPTTSSGENIDTTLFADHTYVLHREDSRGTSVSYIGYKNSDNSITRIATYTIETDKYYTGICGFYFGNVVNDSDPSNLLCELLASQETTSVNYEFKPGDYIRDNGEQTIKINAHLKQSNCWKTLRSATGWTRLTWTNDDGKSGTLVTSGKEQNYYFSIDGTEAGKPCVFYIGMGSFASHNNNWNYVNGGSGKIWDVGDNGCTWAFLRADTNQIVLHYTPGSRTAMMEAWERWMFQRIY